MIARLRAMAGPQVGPRVAERAAPLVDAAIKRSAAAGQSPEGKTWARKKDGGRPMVNAAAHLSTRSYGPRIVVTLTGPDVFHNFGARGQPVRAVLPESGTIPAAIASALHQAAREVWQEMTR